MFVRQGWKVLIMKTDFSSDFSNSMF